MKRFKFLIAAASACIAACLSAGCKNVIKGDTFIEKTYSASGEVTSLELNLRNSVVKVKEYDGESVSVTYSETLSGDKAINSYRVTEENGKLSVTEIKLASELVSMQAPETVVALPTGGSYEISVKTANGAISLKADVAEYSSVKLQTDNGKISVDGELVCASLECDTDNGSIELNGSVYAEEVDCETDNGSVIAAFIAAESVTLKTDIGSIEAKLIDDKTDYDITVSKPSVGSCNVENRKGGSRKLNLTCDVGSIEIIFD